MKAFEKWFGGRDIRSKAFAKAAWRAALKWYSKTMDKIEERNLPISGEEVINKELEEE